MKPSLPQRILAFLLAAGLALPAPAHALRQEPPAEAAPSTLAGLEEKLGGKPSGSEDPGKIRRALRQVRRKYPATRYGWAADLRRQDSAIRQSIEEAPFLMEDGTRELRWPALSLRPGRGPFRGFDCVTCTAELLGALEKEGIAAELVEGENPLWSIDYLARTAGGLLVSATPGIQPVQGAAEATSGIPVRIRPQARPWSRAEASQKLSRRETEGVPISNQMIPMSWHPLGKDRAVALLAGIDLVGSSPWEPNISSVGLQLQGALVEGDRVAQEAHLRIEVPALRHGALRQHLLGGTDPSGVLNRARAFRGAKVEANLRKTSPELRRILLENQDLLHHLAAKFNPQGPISPYLSTAGMEEPVPAEKEPLREFRLGEISLRLVRVEKDLYLETDEPVLREEDGRKTTLRRIDFGGGKNALLKLGSDPGAADIQISGKGISGTHAALILDFGGGVRIIDLGSHEGTVVDGRRLRPPAFFQLAGLTYFLFQRGNRYFISGPAIEGPERLWVPYTEVPFQREIHPAGPGLFARAGLGRHSGNHVQVTDGQISRSHAWLLLMADGKVAIEDRGSTHGTWVGGQRVTGRQLLLDPLEEGTQAELSSPYPQFGEMQRAVREIIFRDHQREAPRITQAIRSLNEAMGASADVTLPFMLAFAIGRGSEEDTEDSYTTAMESYLGAYLERLLLRLAQYGQGETVRGPLATFILYFLLEDRHPELQYAAAVAFRDLSFSEWFQNHLGRILGWLAASEKARDFFDHILLEALDRHGAVEGLISLLESEGQNLNPFLKKQAVEILGRHARIALPKQRLFDLFSRLTADESEQVALAAMEALANTGNYEAALVLAAFASAGKPETALQAKADELLDKLFRRLDAQRQQEMEDTQIQGPPPPSAGLEEGAFMQAEEFIQRYPGQAGRVPAGTSHLLVRRGEGASIHFYSHDTLHIDVQRVVAAGLKELPGLSAAEKQLLRKMIRREKIPASADRLRRPGMLFLDAMEGALDYTPTLPFLTLHKGGKLPRLGRLLSVAFTGRWDAPAIRVLTAWEFEQDGQAVAVLAVQA